MTSNCGLPYWICAIICAYWTFTACTAMPVSLVNGS
jgi:hypothetical protein